MGRECPTCSCAFECFGVGGLVRPRLLDLFCGAGGAGMGYQEAGFDVIGVDLRPQPRYPLPFVQADALEYLTQHGREYDAIHASPPCQRYSKATKVHGTSAVLEHPDLVSPCRLLLRTIGRPWIIENVVGAPLHNPAMLCGTMFGLRVFRHRLFETSFLWLAPSHPRHDGSTGAHRGYSTLASGRNGYICVVGNNFIRTEGAAAMGIDWPTTRRELAQAIPPAYTRFIGQQLLTQLERAA